jgi:hypothetical protein
MASHCQGPDDAPRASSSILAIHVALVKLSAVGGSRRGGRIGAPSHVTINMVASLSRPQTTRLIRHGRKWLIPPVGSDWPGVSGISKQVTRDDVGLDFPDAKAARDTAVTTLPDVARDVMPDGAKRDFIVTMRDESGTPVFRASLSLRTEWLKA